MHQFYLPFANLCPRHGTGRIRAMKMEANPIFIAKFLLSAKTNLSSGTVVY